MAAHGSAEGETLQDLLVNELNHRDQEHAGDGSVHRLADFPDRPPTPPMRNAISATASWRLAARIASLNEERWKARTSAALPKACWSHTRLKPVA